MDFRIYRKVLQMVSKLHVRGYQQLRIVPGMSPYGLAWQFSITPVEYISGGHGAMPVNWGRLMANYSSGMEREYFGWKDTGYLTPSKIANMKSKSHYHLQVLKSI